MEKIRIKNSQVPEPEIARRRDSGGGGESVSSHAKIATRTINGT